MALYRLGVDSSLPAETPTHFFYAIVLPVILNPFACFFVKPPDFFLFCPLVRLLTNLRPPPPTSEAAYSTEMSTTTSSVSATSTACGSGVWQIPTTDAACAAKIRGNVTDVMDQCCGDASTHKYENDCGIYCLAQGQDIKKLQNCITSKSGNFNDVFCNAALNATATATSTKSTSTGTSTSSTGTSTSTGNAAVANQPVSKSGLGMIALLFGSAFMAVLS
ncbi:unnamed protein product [Penicillium salamii]|nr:unnamed protein product [Penicillium salamii]CAG8180849.1 unnamed protein product [Penicillium salamii]CAG8371790.1 unnamed protein product [Penicillium salamii]